MRNCCAVVLWILLLALIVYTAVANPSPISPSSIPCCDWRFRCAQRTGTPHTWPDCSAEVSEYDAPWFGACADPAAVCAGGAGTCLDSNVCLSLNGQPAASAEGCPGNVPGASGMGAPDVS